MIMRKQLFVLFALLTVFAGRVSAYDFEVDGIYYNITSSTDKTVEVTNNTSEVNADSYTGVVSIPASVTYNSNEYSVTSIGRFAFNYCSTLTSVSIPNSITNIEVCSFCYCNNLVNVTIPNSVTTIGEGAFEGCGSLTDVTIPNSVTSIGYGAFSGCGNLKNIVIPNSVTNLSNEAFHGCTGLTNITIPNSITSIGNGTFFCCSNIISVTIPNSVSQIGIMAFGYCDKISDVYNYRDTPQAIGESAFTTYGTLHVLKGCADAYKNAEIWKNFTIVDDLSAEPEKTCATPVIAFSGGRIYCNCETEGAVCHGTYSISESGEIGNTTQITPKITVTAYATKDGYENSPTVTETFDLCNESVEPGDANRDGVISVSDIVTIANMILEK